MTLTFIDGMIAGQATMAAAWWLGGKIARWQSIRKAAENLEPDQQEDNQWQALPGNVLELGATGYQIRFKPTGHGDDWRLYSPEGRPMAYGSEGNLDVLKRYAEKCAAERSKLAARVEGWKP